MPITKADGENSADDESRAYRVKRKVGAKTRHNRLAMEIRWQFQTQSRFALPASSLSRRMSLLYLIGQAPRDDFFSLKLFAQTYFTVSIVLVTPVYATSLSTLANLLSPNQDLILVSSCLSPLTNSLPWSLARPIVV
jgi:hypothetical protein